MSEFRIDVAINPDKAKGGSTQVKKELAKLQRDARILRKELTRALSIRDQGTQVALQKINATLERTERQALVTDARIGQIGRDLTPRPIKRVTQEIDKASEAAKKLRSLLKRAIAGVGVVLIAKQFANLSDTITNTRNQLRLVTDSEEELIATQTKLFEIANETRVAFAGTATIFQRLAVSADDLGTTNRELFQFTKSLNQAIGLSGATAQEASSGLIQLSQGLAAGALRGEEFNSVVEQIPKVADVIAESLGVTRGQLRALAIDGKLTSEVILKAFKEAAASLDEEFATSIPTIGQAFAVLGNKTLALVGDFNDATGIADTFSSGLLVVANNLEGVAAAATVLGTALLVKLATRAIPATVLSTNLLTLANAKLAVSFTIGLVQKAIPAVVLGLKAITAANLRLAVTSIPAALKGLALLNTGAIGAGVALAGVAIKTGLVVKELGEFNKEMDSIRVQVEEDGKAVDATAQQIGNAQRELRRLQRLTSQGLGFEQDDGSIKVFKLTGKAAANVAARIVELDAKIAGLRGTVTGSTEDTAAAAAAAKDLAGATKRQADILKELNGPAEDYRNFQADLQALLADNKIGADQFAKALESARQAFEAESKQEDPFEKQLQTLRKQLAVLEIKRDFTGGELRSRLLINDALFSGIGFTEKQADAARELLAEQEAVTEETRQRDILSGRSAQLAQQNVELQVRLNSERGVEQAFLVEKARLQARGVTLNQDEEASLRAQLTTRQQLTEALQQEQRLDSLQQRVDLTSQLRQEQEDLLLLREREPDLIEEINAAIEQTQLRALDASRDFGDGISRGLIRLKQEAEDLASVGESLVNVFADKATDAIVQFAETGEFAFREFAVSVLKEITRILVRLLVVKTITAAFGGGIGAGLIGGGGGGVGLNAGRAGGGTVQPGQRPFPVGENGAELFTPGRTGTITPSAATQAASAPPPTVNLQAVVVESRDMVPQAIEGGEATDALVIEMGNNRDRFRSALGI